MRFPIILAAAIAGLALFAGGTSAGTSNHACAEEVINEGTAWAYVTVVGDPQVIYDAPTVQHVIVGACVVDNNDGSTLLTPAIPSTSCYQGQFYPITGPDLRVIRVGATPPCVIMSHVDVLISGTPAIKQGDVDCSTVVNSADSLHIQRYSSGLEVFQNEPCPDIGTDWKGELFGDVDCSGAVNSVDSLKIQRFAAGLSYTQNEPCVDIGQNL